MRDGTVGQELRTQEGGGCYHTGQACPGAGCGQAVWVERTAGVRGIPGGRKSLTLGCEC